MVGLGLRQPFMIHDLTPTPTPAPYEVTER
jgi:hypothetical protein